MAKIPAAQFYIFQIGDKYRLLGFKQLSLKNK